MKWQQLLTFIQTVIIFLFVISNVHRRNTSNLSANQQSLLCKPCVCNCSKLYPPPIVAQQQQQHHPKWKGKEHGIAEQIQHPAALWLPNESKHTNNNKHTAIKHEQREHPYLHPKLNSHSNHPIMSLKDPTQMKQHMQRIQHKERHQTNLMNKKVNDIHSKAFDAGLDNPITRESLVDLYHSTGGNDWVNNSNWLSNEVSYCNWYGIYCNTPTDMVVIGISLENNNLHGSLPDSIGN